MKKFIALLLVLTLTLGLCACGGGSGDNGGSGDGKKEYVPGEPLNIMMYVVQTLGNRSCEDLIYDSVKQFCEETGSKLTTFECHSDDSVHPAQLPQVCEGGYDVIITGYWNMQEHIENTAKMFPDQKWIIFDTNTSNYYAEVDPANSNIACYQADQNTLAFMAGALAALMTTETSDSHINPDKKIGFVGAQPNQAILDFLVGYIDGANYVDPDTEVLIGYGGDWENQGNANETATAQYTAGADISFAVCGNAGFGVCEAAAQTGRYAFGVDTDFGATLAAGGSDTANYVVSSAIKQFGDIVYDALYSMYDGTIKWEFHQLGVTTGYLDLVENDQFNKIVKEGMPEVYAKYEAILADLEAGKIKVNTAIGASPEEVAAMQEGAKPGVSTLIG